MRELLTTDDLKEFLLRCSDSKFLRFCIDTSYICQTDYVIESVDTSYLSYDRSEHLLDLMIKHMEDVYESKTDLHYNSSSGNLSYEEERDESFSDYLYLFENYIVQDKQMYRLLDAFNRLFDFTYTNRSVIRMTVKAIYYVIESYEIGYFKDSNGYDPALEIILKLVQNKGNVQIYDIWWLLNSMIYAYQFTGDEIYLQYYKSEFEKFMDNDMHVNNWHDYDLCLRSDFMEIHPTISEVQKNAIDLLIQSRVVNKYLLLILSKLSATNYSTNSD